MPLPAALLQKLKKRGIIKEAENQEEIIAESYDDEIRKDQQNLTAFSAPSDGSSSTGAPGCPNKCNPFHVCVEWCWDHWGDGVPEDRVDPDYTRRRLRMLAKYPLPMNWKEIYDPGAGRYYYWNLDSDEVCWLSPSHPKAKITVSACRVAKNEWEKILQKGGSATSTTQSRKDGGDRTGLIRKRKDSLDGSDSDNRSDDEDMSSRRKKKGSTGKSRKPPKDLDPMDPAAYSDIPRGKWSTGLESRGDAKTGVDTTATGPLFQQRPYPAPGAVLRQNMEHQQSAERRKRWEMSP